MPAAHAHTATQYLRAHSIPLVPASLQDPCSICLQPYTAPLALACGHVFCRECIERWLKGGAQTCPSCRVSLFHAWSGDGATQVEEDGVDVRALFGLYAGPLMHRSVVEARVDGVVVARDGVLTRRGARLLLYSLWCGTWDYFSASVVFLGRGIGLEEASEWDVEMLRNLIWRAVPGGVRLGEGGWAVLYDSARLMMGWHAMGRSGEARWRAEGEEEWPSSEALEGLVEALMEACAAELI